MARSMSSRSRTHAERGQELDPYGAILSLLAHQQEQVPVPTAAEADAAFREVVELTLQLFAEYARAHGNPPLPEPHALTATEAALVSTHVLRAVDIALFELAMWQSWSGAGEIDALRVDAGATKNAGREDADG